MIGTSKQIEIANNLLIMVREGVLQKVKEAEDRSANGFMPQSYGIFYRKEQIRFFDYLASFDDAVHIIKNIENRTKYFVEAFDVMANDEWLKAITKYQIFE